MDVLSIPTYFLIWKTEYLKDQVVHFGSLTANFKGDIIGKVKLGGVLGPGINYRGSVGARAGCRNALVLTSVHGTAVEDRVWLAGGLAAEENHVVSCILVGQGFESRDVDGLRGVELHRSAEVRFRLGRLRVRHQDLELSGDRSVVGVGVGGRNAGRQAADAAQHRNNKDHRNFFHFGFNLGQVSERNWPEKVSLEVVSFLSDEEEFLATDSRSRGQLFPLY